MSHQILLVIVVVYFFYALITRKVDNTLLTPPILFTVTGFLLGAYGLGLIPINTSAKVIHTMAEAALILVLFADASKIDIKTLRHDFGIPGRMLLVGMPLTILLGTFVAFLLFPYIGIWQAAVLAAVLAPTDAALGQAVVSNTKVPLRIRQGINVESGLNDGLALPVMLVFISLVAVMSGADQDRNWVSFIGLQLTLGPLCGIVCGYLGAKGLDIADTKGWVNSVGIGFASFAIALASYFLAETLHGNGFIAAFIGGLCFGNTYQHRCHIFYEFSETHSHLLVTFTFLMFGAVILPSVLPLVEWQHVLYALCSLTFIRMLPIYLSLWGSKLKPWSKLYLGWFGPRGLASVLFALLILEEFELPNLEVLLVVVFLTVAMSIFLHGVSAAFLSEHYARYVKNLDHRSSTPIEETVEVEVTAFERFKNDKAVKNIKRLKSE